MSAPRFDVLGIGNAIYDVLAHVEDDFLNREKLTKGSMRLIEADEATRLYDLMGPAMRASGGCAGNTVSGVASFGGKAAFIGKVAADEVGDAYRHDMRGFGVAFDTAPLEADDERPTARSMIIITPDGERTMNTYLGAAQALTPDDIDPDVVASSAITYLEGYLWDPEHAKDAFRLAASIAHAHNRKVAFTLSDTFCVDRYRDEFLDLIARRSIDILFANEHELKALYQTSDLDTALNVLAKEKLTGVVTLGADGAVLLSEGNRTKVSARPVQEIVDLTGAGDLFASGVLFGIAKGYSLTQCGELGALAASEIITHIGARPEKRLQYLASQIGLAA
jgi:adenosine kinase